MSETRQQLKERLQAAGLWQDFVALRENLTADGMTPAQAKEEALRRVEANISEPPSVNASIDLAPAVTTETPSVQQSLPDFSKRVPNSEAVRWVAENLANPNVRAEDCPGGQAWALLAWVRLSPANQSTFWASIWPKLLATGAASKNGREAEKDDDEPDEPVMTLIDDLLDAWEKEAERLRIQKNGVPCLAKGGG